MLILNEFQQYSNNKSKNGQSSEVTAINSLVCVLEGFVFFLERADHFFFPIKQGHHSFFKKCNTAWTSFHISTHMSALFCLTAAANSMMLLIVVDLTTSLSWTFWILPGDSYAASQPLSTFGNLCFAEMGIQRPREGLQAGQCHRAS